MKLINTFIIWNYLSVDFSEDFSLASYLYIPESFIGVIIWWLEQ